MDFVKFVVVGHYDVSATGVVRVAYVIGRVVKD